MDPDVLVVSGGIVANDGVRSDKWGGNNITLQLEVQQSPNFSTHLRSWLGIPIFSSNFWDPNRKRNFNSTVFDSGDSGRIFFEIPMSGKSENWNSNLQNLEFQLFVCAVTHYVSLFLICIRSKACTMIYS